MTFDSNWLAFLLHDNCLNLQMFEKAPSETTDNPTPQTGRAYCLRMQWCHIPLNPYALRSQSNAYARIGGLQTTKMDYRAVSVLLTLMSFFFSMKTWPQQILFVAISWDVQLCIPGFVQAFAIVVLLVCSQCSLWERLMRRRLVYVHAHICMFCSYGMLLHQTTGLACTLQHFLCSWKRKGGKALPVWVAPVFSGSCLNVAQVKQRDTQLKEVNETDQHYMYGSCQPLFQMQEQSFL